MRTSVSVGRIVAIVGSMVVAQVVVGQPVWADPPMVAVAPAAPAVDTTLADYVRQPDDHYRWSVRRRGSQGTGRFAELILSSQRWHGDLWRHQLFVYRPKQVLDPTRAILVIGGGSWSDELAKPAAGDEKLSGEFLLLTNVADRLGIVVALVKQVPHQPIFDELYEDGAISYTFRQFITTGDATWPLLLPMVKSATRAMDAVGEFTAQEWPAEAGPAQAASAKPMKFTLTGASKRGWTTWLTAAVDPRVEALAPMVIDMLDLSRHLKLQVDSWGGYSEQLVDYTQLGIQLLVDTPLGKKLLEIVDPYRYLSRIPQPKLVLLGTNDRYWPLEALNLYWDALPGDKYVCYVPNNGHGLNDLARVVGGIGALQRHAAGRLKLPKLGWDYTPTAEALELAIRSDRRPEEVVVWQATSLTRDFRDSVWTKHPTTEKEGTYRYRLPTPTRGCTAIFGEARYADEVLPYYFSTQVRVIGSPAKPKAK
ncbi:MAG: PhoPQ-activated pathogenicity-related family protein [Planctomycetia bacterium]|nr:PhoPQ-activated pathogenicity-related family protein [Planctomycetia bacterium]